MGVFGFLSHSVGLVADCRTPRLPGGGGSVASTEANFQKSAEKTAQIVGTEATGSAEPIAQRTVGGGDHTTVNGKAMASTEAIARTLKINNLQGGH